MFVSKVMKLPSAVPDISHVTYLMFFIVQYVAFFYSEKKCRAEGNKVYLCFVSYLKHQKG